MAFVEPAPRPRREPEPRPRRLTSIPSAPATRDDNGLNEYGRQQSIERFWAHVDRTFPDECWPWTGSKNAGGYGRWGGSPYWPGDTYAHRIAYRMTVGPIPDGFEVDHRCHNEAGDSCPLFSDGLCPHRACVNPIHLVAVPLADNRRSRPRRPLPARCRHDHELTEANTYVNPRTGQWACRECTRAALRRYHHRNRDEQNAKRQARRQRTGR